MSKDTAIVVAAVAGATALVVGMGIADNGAATHSDTVAARSSRQMPRMVVEEKLREAGEAEREREGFEPGEGEGAREAENESLNGPAQQQYDQRAYPRAYITSTRTEVAQRAYATLPDATPVNSFKAGTKNRAAKASLAQSWQSLGPTNPVVPGVVTYTGATTTNSGRVTAMMIDPDTCVTGDCRVWVAAAGGGVWRTGDATAAQPQWTALDKGLTSNTFGSLAMDPQDTNVIYAGSGEPSGSSDSEAGVGLFKSTDGGDTWALLPGLLDVAPNNPVADQRSIAAILVDPTDSDTIWIGTALARHGSSSVNGGRRTPPDAPTLGIYKSTDGGGTFSLEYSVDPKTLPPATGRDYFTGGVRRLEFDPNDPTQIYASIQGYGIYRHGNPNDPTGWNQIYASEWGEESPQGNDPDPFGAFTDFGLASTDSNTNTRLYVGDTSDDYGVATFYRADAVNTINAADLVAAEDPLSAPWQLKSDDSMANPEGYSSYNWCQNGQCSYDAFVKVDPTNPDVVWLGGSMTYNELEAFGEKGVSNGRAVVRSTNGGDSFTDMTNDNADPSIGMHPDQRAIVLNPQNTAQAIIGSDGGVVRTSGLFVDQSDRCSTRGLNTEELAFCELELSQVPTRIDSLNVGLDTLQFQSLTVNTAQPLSDVIGGTQDNGTWAWDGSDSTTAWFESVGGDGGQSGISPGANSRMHTYYGTAGDMNFNGNDPQGWNYVTGPIDYSGEGSSFYVPLITDPMAAGTYYMGAESVWRTQDSGGDPQQLKTQCNELSGTGPFDDTCGDWVAVGPTLASSSSDYLVALARTSADSQTMWAGTRFGGLFISQNIAASPAAVDFKEIDTATTPGRFISGIAVDPANPNHAWISYSGYSAYTPATPGHVFEAVYDPVTGTATFTDRSYDLGDQPVTGIGVDWTSGDVYASTDFGVTRLASGATAWATAADGLPPVATYGLTMDSNARVLYAATHGRGAYRVALDPVAKISGPTAAEVGTPVSFSSTGSVGYGTTGLKWTLPDGSTATADSVQYTPKTAGAQQVRLQVTDSLGHSTSTSLSFTATAKPTTALTPLFGAVTSKVGGFTAQVSNYNPAFMWAVAPSVGTATINGSGLITVSGLTAGQKSTVTVTTSRSGFPNGTATVTGSALEQCSLTVKAKKSSYKLPKSGTVKVVTKATASGPKCTLRPAQVQAVPLSGSGDPQVSVERLDNGGLRLTTNGPRVKVTVTYVSRSSTPGVKNATWTRTWRSKK